MKRGGGKEVEISVDLSAIEAVYSNAVHIVHSPFDFVFNFVQVSPPKGKLVAKVILSPQHAKSFVEALKENIAKYEAQYGLINISKEMKEERPFGFVKEG